MKHFIKAIAILILLFFIFRDEANSADFTCLTTVDVQVKGLYSMPKYEFYSLIDVKKDYPTNQEDIRRSVKRLFRKGIFKDIIVSVKEQTDNTCVIEFQLIEKNIIRAIRIENNNHFTHSFIKKHLTIESGDRVKEKQIQETIKTLKSVMKQHGFVNVSITYQIIHKENNYVDLLLDIQEGQPTVIKEIQINDKSGLIRDFLPLSEGEPFDVVLLEKMKERINEYVKKKRFVSSKIDYSFDEGILKIEFDIGKQAIISFIGNDEISRDSINKELPLIELSGINDEVIEEFKKRIMNLYYDRGYSQVSIIPTFREEEGVIYIEFFIFEGHRFVIEDILFVGNSIPENKLKSLLPLRRDNPYNPNLINSSMEILKEFYMSMGYVNTVVNIPEIKISNDKVLIQFNIIEGVQRQIKSIDFVGNSIFSTQRLRDEVTIKEGSPVNEIDIAESKRRILDLYKKMGFDHVRVIINKDNEVNLQFVITENQPILFGKTLFRGYKNTKYWVFHRERLHKEKDLFQRAVILRERQKLYRTGLFSDIQIEFSDPYYATEPVDTDVLYRDVIFTVNEAPAGAVEFGVGYGEYEHLRGFIELSYKNLWGLNRQGTFRTEVSSVEQRFILSYYDPWFFRDNLPLKGLLLHEKRVERSLDSRDIRYKLIRTTASLGVEKKTTENINVEFFYDFSVVNTYDVQPDIVLTKEDTGTLIISALRPGLIYDTRDSPFEPTSGILAGVTAKVASFLLFSETDFAKLSFYVNNYLAITKDVVFATSLRGGLARGFRKTQELPLVERFFLGGRTTVRGYEQDGLGPKGNDGNPTGGNLFAMGNIEFRTNIGKGIGIVNFLDFGNVWQRTDQLSGLKYTTGIGLRYNTPVGPLRVDYGFKLNKDKGDSKGALHFSLGHAF